MTPAGTSNELDVQNEGKENTHTHTLQKNIRKGMSYTSCQEYGTAHFKLFSGPKNHIIFHIYEFQYYLSVVIENDDPLF